MKIINKIAYLILPLAIVNVSNVMAADNNNNLDDNNNLYDNNNLLGQTQLAMKLNQNNHLQLYNNSHGSALCSLASLTQLLSVMNPGNNQFSKLFVKKYAQLAREQKPGSSVAPETVFKEVLFNLKYNVKEGSMEERLLLEDISKFLYTSDEAISARYNILQTILEKYTESNIINLNAFIDLNYDKYKYSDSASLLATIGEAIKDHNGYIQKEQDNQKEGEKIPDYYLITQDAKNFMVDYKPFNDYKTNAKILDNGNLSFRIDNSGNYFKLVAISFYSGNGLGGHYISAKKNSDGNWTYINSSDVSQKQYRDFENLLYKCQTTGALPRLLLFSKKENNTINNNIQNNNKGKNEDVKNLHKIANINDKVEIITKIEKYKIKYKRILQGSNVGITTRLRNDFVKQTGIKQNNLEDYMQRCRNTINCLLNKDSNILNDDNKFVNYINKNKCDMLKKYHNKIKELLSIKSEINTLEKNYERVCNIDKKNKQHNNYINNPNDNINKYKRSSSPNRTIDDFIVSMKNKANNKKGIIQNNNNINKKNNIRTNNINNSPLNKINNFNYNQYKQFNTINNINNNNYNDGFIDYNEFDEDNINLNSNNKNFNTINNAVNNDNNNVIDYNDFDDYDSYSFNSSDENRSTSQDSKKSATEKRLVEVFNQINELNQRFQYNLNSIIKEINPTLQKKSKELIQQLITILSKNYKYFQNEGDFNKYVANNGCKDTNSKDLTKHYDDIVNLCIINNEINALKEEQSLLKEELKKEQKQNAWKKEIENVQMIASKAFIKLQDTIAQNKYKLNEDETITFIQNIIKNNEKIRNAILNNNQYLFRQCLNEYLETQEILIKEQESDLKLVSNQITKIQNELKSVNSQINQTKNNLKPNKVTNGNKNTLKKQNNQLNTQQTNKLKKLNAQYNKLQKTENEFKKQQQLINIQIDTMKINIACDEKKIDFMLNHFDLITKWYKNTTMAESESSSEN